jgi:hypothetical protein
MRKSKTSTTAIPAFVTTIDVGLVLFSVAATSAPLVCAGC